MRTEDCPDLELVVTGQSSSGTFRVRGVPLLVQIVGSTNQLVILDLNYQPDEVLSERACDAFRGQRLDVATLKELAKWLKEQYALNPLF